MPTIRIYNSQRKIAIDKEKAEKVVEFLLDYAKIKCDEVAISFVGKKKISQIHAEAFNDPSPTDCITFPCDAPGSGGYTFLGEGFICPEMALEQENDLHLEITLYIVHVLLHMIGYDDIDPKERKKMRAAEKRWLGALEQAKIYL